MIYGDGISIIPVVPEYEAREAAVYCHYNYTEFLELDPFERAKCVAQYREHFRIEANMSDAAESSSRSKKD